MKLTIQKLVLALAATAAAIAFTIPKTEGDTFNEFADEVPAQLGERLTPEDHDGEAPRLEILTPGVDPADLPLLSSKAKVNIAGMIADVQITQVYLNEGDHPIEAKYVFPGSNRAAVHGMRMKIGDRVVEAQVKEKTDAKRIYAEAKSKGQTASLLTQQRPNVFEMDVANIQPADRVEIILDYTEHLVPTNRIYEFVYPTAVAKRYGTGHEGWEGNPYIKDDNDHSGRSHQQFDIQVDLNTGMPIDDVRCISHQVETDYLSKSRASLTLKPGQEHAANRDYVLQYRLAGKQVASGLMVYEDPEHHENFFLLNVQPPKLTRAGDIPPREYVFVIDISGSMNGFPINTAKELLRNLLPRMRPVDRFNLILFAGSDRGMSEESVPATQKNIDRAIRVIEQQGGRGGTEMLPPMRKAFDMPSKQGVSRNIVLITDGLVNFEKQTFELIRENLGEANVFTFGIGGHINRYLLEGVARTGCGLPIIVTDQSYAKEASNKFWKYISAPVLTDIEIDYGGLEVYDVEPPSVPDVIADRPVVVFGKWRGEADGKIKITGRGGSEQIEMQLALADSSTNPALPYLWARSRIATLGDYQKLAPDDETVTEITNLGLTYNLLTDYTAFVAVMPDQVAEQGPAGKSSKTLKPVVTPEPGSTMLLILSLGTLLLRRKR